MDILELRFRSQDRSLDIESAAKESLHHTIEAVLRGLITLPLDEHHLTRIQLGNAFRDAIQSEPKRRPNGLASIISCAQDSSERSIEAQLFRKGGKQAVVAYALAALDNRQVVNWAKSIPNDQLDLLADSTKNIKASEGFLRVVVTTDDKKQPGSQKAYVPGPRDYRGRGSKEKAHMLEGKRGYVVFGDNLLIKL